MQVLTEEKKDYLSRQDIEKISDSYLLFFLLSLLKHFKLILTLERFLQVTTATLILYA